MYISTYLCSLSQSFYALFFALRWILDWILFQLVFGILRKLTVIEGTEEIS